MKNADVQNKMLIKSTRITKTFVWILTALFMGAGVLSNITLCLEEDGQLEIACDCSFSGYSQPASPGIIDKSLVSGYDTIIDQCIPCIDFAFSLGTNISNIRTQQKAFDINSPVTFSPTLSFIKPENTLSSEVSYSALPYNNHSLSFLNTVVLLI